MLFRSLAELRQRISGQLDRSAWLPDRPAITNVRHTALLERARVAIGTAAGAVGSDPQLSEEFVLADLREARQALEEVTGRRTPDDVLAHIFARFCIGK